MSYTQQNKLLIKLLNVKPILKPVKKKKVKKKKVYKPKLTKELRLLRKEYKETINRINKALNKKKRLIKPLNY